MKNKKIIILILIALVIIITGIVVFFVLPPEKQEQKKSQKEIREYQTITQNAPTEDKTFTNKEPIKTDFEDNAKEIGFEKSSCEEEGCIATNDGYSNFEHQDSISYGKDEKNNKTFSTSLYFHKNDFTIDNIYSNINAVVKNFYNEEITKKQIDEVKTGLENSTEDYYQKTYISGQYTIEINMQNVVGTEFKLVKYQILNTELYNLYHNS